MNGRQFPSTNLSSRVNNGLACRMASLVQLIECSANYGHGVKIEDRNWQSFPLVIYGLSPRSKEKNIRGYEAAAELKIEV
jgi:hypothetical protein